MYVIVVQLKVKPERIDAFLTLTLANAGGARREPGCVRFDVLRQENDPTRFVFYEAYRSTDDFKAHQQTEHYLAWKAGVPDLLAEPRVSAKHLSAFPEDSAW